MTDAPDKVLDQIAKLFQLASKNSNEAEASAALNKANALMVQWNLTTSAVERRQGAKDGKREDTTVEGGFYQYQRDLWQAVAKLNFCICFTEEYAAKLERTYSKTERDTGITRTYNKGDTRWRRRQRIVGRIVNVEATKATANYLLMAIGRVLRERVRRSDGTIGAGVMMDKWAVSFREGCAANLINRVRLERAKNEKERQAAMAAAAKADREAGRGSTATAVALADLEETEHAANYDVLFGDGAWAKAQQEAEDDARAEALEDERRAKLALENPKELARIEEEERKERRSSGGSSERRRKKDWGGYWAGKEAGDEISLSMQVGDKPAAAKLRIGHAE